MQPAKEWRFEVYNPNTSTEWLPLFDVGEEQLQASQELRDELNLINSPVQVRIVQNTQLS